VLVEASSARGLASKPRKGDRSGGRSSGGYELASSWFSKDVHGSSH
jgi:hypothetical protein